MRSDSAAPDGRARADGMDYGAPSPTGGRTPVPERPVAGRLPLALAIRGATPVGDSSGGTGVRESFIGRVVEDGGRLFVNDPWQKQRVPLDGTLAPGAWVKVGVKQGPVGPTASALGEPVAAAGTGRAEMYAIAAAHGMDPTFPPGAMKEVRELQKNPGIDDPSLVDLTGKPFVTIDNPDSRDLDQAMCIERTPDGGYEILYALADASYYVEPGTELWDEAMKRGTSFYLPGLCIPMLPEELSEGLVSLNEGVDRRALVYRMKLDKDGNVEKTDVERARIHSRKKLSYEGVQAYHDAEARGQGGDDPHHGQDFTETLHLLEEVGDKRMRLSDDNGVIRYKRRPVKVHIDEGSERVFNLLGGARNECEKWNEQVSLLVNSVGADILKNAASAPGADNVQAVFKAHEAPDDNRVRSFSFFMEDLVKKKSLDPDVWGWDSRGDVPLADFLSSLPESGEEGRLSAAISRQAMIMNNRSLFQEQAAPHHGVGSEAYARLSSPMREMVGIFTHKEAIEVVEGRASARPSHDDEKLRDDVIQIANDARARQSGVTKAANKLAIDAVFGGDLQAREDGDPVKRGGTVMGVTRSKVYVRLDDPPIDVKVYLSELANRRDCDFHTDRNDVFLYDDDGPVCAVGDTIDLEVTGYDEKYERWLLEPTASQPD